jgi:hypothetical protein
MSTHVMGQPLSFPCQCRTKNQIMGPDLWFAKLVLAVGVADPNEVSRLPAVLATLTADTDSLAFGLTQDLVVDRVTNVQGGFGPDEQQSLTDFGRKPDNHLDGRPVFHQRTGKPLPEAIKPLRQILN